MPNIADMPRCGHVLSVAACLAVAAPAEAQQAQLTDEEVRAYFEEVEREATEMVRAEELERIVEWIERNIADGAQFQVSMSLHHGGERKGFAALTLDKDDMLRMGGMFVGAFQQMPIENYELDIAVDEVTPLGADAATVRARWTERFAIGMPQGEGAETPDGQTLSVEGVADCVQIVQRDGDRLVMGLMTCTADMRL